MAVSRAVRGDPHTIARLYPTEHPSRGLAELTIES